MKVTRQIVADKIADYLHGKVSQTELVDWAERAMMDADFDESDTDLLTDILGRLGLAADFPLGRWASALPQRRAHLGQHLIDLVDSHVLPLDGVPRWASGHVQRVAVRLDPVVERSKRRKRVRVLGDLTKHR